MPQDRLRKLTEENQELARNLKKEMDAQRRAAAKPIPTSTRKRAFGSELNTASSTRGSEEVISVAAAAPPPSRGTKRGREYEGIDKVCDGRSPISHPAIHFETTNASNVGCFSASSHPDCKLVSRFTLTQGTRANHPVNRKKTICADLPSRSSCPRYSRQYSWMTGRR